MAKSSVELQVPIVRDALGISNNLKTILAARLSDVDVKITEGEDAYPVLKIDAEHQLIEPNAIVR